jgi:hypothetical protein
MIGAGFPQHLRFSDADHGRCLQGGLGAGYDESSVSDITHSVGVMTFGTLGVVSKRLGPESEWAWIWPPATSCGEWSRMSDLVDLTSRLLDDGFVICSEKTGDRFTVLLRRTRAEGRRVFCGTGESFPDALVDAAEEAEVPAA